VAGKAAPDKKAAVGRKPVAKKPVAKKPVAMGTSSSRTTGVAGRIR
jgi:hypothetical protein